MEVVHGPVPEPDPELFGRADSGADEGLAARDRLPEAETLGEPGGDRRGQGAAGAVGIPRRDPGRGEAADARRVDEDVDALGTLGMPTLDQHRAGAEGQDALALRAHR